jgi:universal stress protein A
MKLERIICPTDFSESSAAALAYASLLARESGARLYIVYVDSVLDLNLDPSYPQGACAVYDAPWGHERREIRQRIETVVPTEPNVAFEQCYLTGPPVAKLLKFAHDQHADLIVMGSHGRTGCMRLLMGSVAEGVVRNAECPVIVIKKAANNTDADTSCALETPIVNSR